MSESETTSRGAADCGPTAECGQTQCSGFRRAPEKTMRNQDVLSRFVRLYEDVFAHDGFGEIRVEVKILRKGQKEIIIHCGKQYRFVVDSSDRQPLRWGIWRVEGNAPDQASGPEASRASPSPAIPKRINLERS
ncbi:MAG: hypothetical protein PHX38_00675 [Sulfuricella sp.]|nr:hypothetical protein [Sulfuricella sp.]